MAGEPRSTGPGAAPPGLLFRGLALSGAVGSRGPHWSRTPRGARLWRLAFSGIWLLYLGQPVGGLFRHHYGLFYIGGALAIVVVFCVIYLYVIAAWDVRRRLTAAGMVALFALAALACVVYNGAKWNALWIFVAAACGLVFTNRRVAVRAVFATGACFLLFSWIGHDKASDFLVSLLPVLFVGFLGMGLRMQVEMTRELTAARETVALMAASEERLRLARDMHDLTGQSLSMITLKSELAARLLRRLPEGPDRDRVSQEIEQVAAVSRQTLHDIREAISGYRRPTLAVEIITARTALEAAGIIPHDDADLTLLSGTFDPEAEAALAWCLREAVTNVVRHSGATNCYVSLTRKPGAQSLVVRDDGRGCAGPSSSGTGLRGMSERLSAVGGDLDIAPGTADGGFRLTATVPVETSVTVAT